MEHLTRCLTALATACLLPRLVAAQIPDLSKAAGSLNPLKLSSTTENTAEPNCFGLKLKAASGVPGAPIHEYLFVGACFDGERSFPAEAKVRWDGNAQTLTEVYRIIGTFVNKAGKSYSGTVRSVLKCNDDVLIAPGACNGESHLNQTGAVFLSNRYKRREPITMEKTSLSEAATLSKFAAKALKSPGS